MFFYTLMPKLFNMSLTASVAIVLVVLLRLLLKKAPKVISYALWGVVLFRLLCPVSIGSGISLFNLFDVPAEESGKITSVIEYVPTDVVHTEEPSVVLPVPGIGDAISETLPQGEEQLRADPLEGPIFIAAYVWMTGILVMAIYSIVSYIGLRRKLSVVVPLRDNIFIADDIKSPFVVGLFRPKIYLPCNLGEKEQEYIILHEKHHIKRLDHIVKALAFLTLAIHWFNPLVWVAFILVGKDMEMSCDEAVIRKVDGDVRADYSASLLTLATGRRIIAGTPLAFGEGDTRGRINNLSKWKKPAFWVVLLAVVVSVVLAIGLLTNPVKSQDFLELIDKDTLAGANEAVYSANFGNQVHGGLIYAEQWSNGECVRSSPVMLTQDVEKIGVRTDVRREDGASVGVDVQIDTYGSGGSLITYFAFSKPNAFLGWSFETNEVNKPVAVTAQNDIILAAMAFDAGDGVRAYDCQTLVTNPEYLEGADYMIVIRACFNNAPMQLNQPYGVVEVTYESGMTSFSMVAQVNTPEYMLDKNYHLFSVKEYTEAPEWTDLGELNEVTITKENFDELFRNNSGDGWLNRESASSIRRRTAKAWSVIYNQERFYYILQQENGELYLAYGYYDYSEKDDPGSDDTYIRWLYKIAPDDTPLNQGQDANGIVDIVDPTKDGNLTYDAAMEKFYEDERNEYFFGGIYSQYVIVHYDDGTTEDISTALQNGRTTLADLDRFGIRYWTEPKVNSLDAAISLAILNHYRSDKPDGLIHVESHVLLANEVMSGTPLVGADNHAKKITAYLLVHQAKYSTYGGKLEAAGGSYLPTAITFKISEDGEYIPEEYWEPRDGGYYVDDIRGKFPGSSADDALNDQAYIEDLKAQNYNKALAYLNGVGSLDNRIAELLQEIQSSPAYSSNPGDYIRAHEAEYEKLLSYSEYTLRYCFTEFLKGGQIDLRGHIMALACQDIMLALGEGYTIDQNPSTGQNWFDSFRGSAENLAGQLSYKELEEHYPVSFLLLRLSNDTFSTKNARN